jgi:anti-sigma B factor antagonist
MPINVRVEGEIVILSNFARLMNDPRHFDAGRDVKDLLDQDHHNFILDLGGLREIGSSGLGLLTTLTRLIRQHDGDAVLANLGFEAEAFKDSMRMDSYWDLFEAVDEARKFLAHTTG